MEADERPGDKIAGVGYDAYHVRLRNQSAQKGKSSGFRVIYYIRLVDNVVLLTIYSKSQKTDMSAKKIRQLIEDVIREYENNNPTDND